jgi:hypothetical protein
MFIRQVDAGIRGIIPSRATLFFSFDLEQRGYRLPILATVRVYRILQLAVFDYCPFTRTPTRLVEVVIHDIIPSGTTRSAAMAPQFLSPCVCTASFSLLSSSSKHLPVRPRARSMLGSKGLVHLQRHCFSPRPGTRAAIAPHLLTPCVSTASFSLMSSSSSHFPYALSLGRCCDPRLPSISNNSVIVFDPDPVRQLRPTPCHRAIVPHPSTSCLRLLSIYPHVPSSGPC